MNRTPMIITCHRVTGSDGKMTVYRGVIWRKRRLPELEKGSDQELWD